jgi:hypothetical protein
MSGVTEGAPVVSIQFLPPPDRLSPAEVAQLVDFAVRSALAIEAGTTEDGSCYLALHYGASHGMNDISDTWIVSREIGCVVAFHERRGLLLQHKGVTDLLADLRAMLPTNERGDPELKFGGQTHSCLHGPASVRSGHTKVKLTISCEHLHRYTQGSGTVAHSALSERR